MKRSFLKIVIISIMLILIYSTIVSAYSYNTSMTPSSTSVGSSEELTVNVKVSNLDVGDGINTFSGVISYDQEIFEKISDSSVEALNGWSANYNSDNGKVTLTKMNKVKTEEDILQITLKTKSDASGVGKVSLTSIVASNSQDDISGTDISVSITVGSGTTSTNTAVINAITNTATINATSTNRTIISPVTNNTVNNTSNNNKVNNTIQNNSVNTNTRNNAVSSYVNTSATSSNEDMPHTGVEDTLFYIIIAIVIAAIVFYIKFEKINKEMK